MDFNQEEQEINKEKNKQQTLNNLNLLIRLLGLKLDILKTSEGNYQFLENDVICGEGKFTDEDSVFDIKIISDAGVITSKMPTCPKRECNRPTLKVETAEGEFEVTTQIVNNSFENIILSKPFYNERCGFLIGGSINCLTRFPNYSEDYFRFKKSKNPDSLKLIIDVNIPTLEQKLYIRSTLDAYPITRMDLFDVRNNRYIPTSKVYRQSLEQDTQAEKMRTIIDLCYPEFSTRLEEMLSEYDFGNINLVQNALEMLETKKDLNKLVEEICFKEHKVKTLTKKNI